jgi:hypothetical protein
MRTSPLRHEAKSFPALYLTVLWLVLGSSNLLHAHSGAPLAAPTQVSSSITLDGTIDSVGTETVWGAGVTAAQVANNCSEFNGTSPAPPLTVYALNDGANPFLAFDVPDSTADANDRLFLFFDPNHSAGSTPAAGDQALQLVFDNLAANNVVPTAQHYSGTGTGWSAGTAGLPIGVQATYRRDATGPGRWQLELTFPFTGPTVGVAVLYLNATGAAAEDCNGDGIIDDFYARFPSRLTVVSAMSLPTGIANPGVWGDLNFGPQPPTVSFQPPLCCSSADINFTPSIQPFTAGVPVDIQARVHNLHATSVANNVNVEIRVHNFGTGGGGTVVFSDSTVIPAIAPSSNSSSSPVTWSSPPAGLHGCIRAEIKPPTVSQYFIAGGNTVAQENIDVACIPKGQRRAFRFIAFNPQPKERAKIILAKEELLPPGLDGLKFALQQPDRPLRPQEEVPVRLMVTASPNLPVTQVPKQTVSLLPTAGGTAVPPLRKRTGTDPVSMAVRSGERMHLTAFGRVDIDGRGRLPSVGPEGRDFSRNLRGKRCFLLSGKAAGRFAGALIGSFDAFKSSFVVGSEITITVPDGAEKLWVAVNDIDGGYAHNRGRRFAVERATLPGLPLQAIRAPTTQVVKGDPVVLPQVNITATSTARVVVGQHVYNLLTNHGGVTYQFLVTDHGAVGPRR